MGPKPSFLLIPIDEEYGRGKEIISRIWLAHLDPMYRGLDSVIQCIDGSLFGNEADRSRFLHGHLIMLSDIHGNTDHLHSRKTGLELSCGFNPIHHRHID